MHAEKVSRYPSKWIGMYFVLLALCLLSTFFLYSTYRNNETVLQDTMREDILMDIVNDSSISHVMLMDEIIGYSHGGMEAILAGFEISVKRFDMLLEGGKHRNDDLESLQDPYLRTLAEDSKAHLLGLIFSTKDIYQKADETKDIASLEHRHNEIFDSFIRKTGKLEDKIEIRLEQKEHQSETVFWNIFFLWIFIVVVSIAWLLKLEFTRTREEYDTKSNLISREQHIRELHHRVNNNLAIAQSMIEIQSRKTSDLEAKKVLKELRNRISAMGTLHRMIQTSVDLKHISLGEYVRTLAKQIFGNYQVDTSRVKLILDIDEIEANIDDLTPYGLILNELITNAVKYAFPDNREGELLVSFKNPGNGKQTLVVKDNGIGLPKDLDVNKGESLGMQLVTLLTMQVGGVLDINKEGGTEFILTISDED
jgi:two-component sensor histidine kinase